MKYLDPRNIKFATQISVPGADRLTGKKLGFINNGWMSMAKIGTNIEGPLKTEHGVAEVIYYDVPRAMAPPAGLLEQVARECELAIVGLAN